MTKSVGSNAPSKKSASKFWTQVKSLFEDNIYDIDFDTQVFEWFMCIIYLL